MQRIEGGKRQKQTIRPRRRPRSSNPFRGFGMGLAMEIQGCKKVSQGGRQAISSSIDIITDLQIEFCKTKARANRWHEEVELLKEEMERVKQFFQTCSLEWLGLTSGNPDVSSIDLAEIEARRAYALEQSPQFERMYDHCVKSFSKYHA
jgi:hypothetical protein